MYWCTTFSHNKDVAWNMNPSRTRRSVGLPVGWLNETLTWRGWDSRDQPVCRPLWGMNEWMNNTFTLDTTSGRDTCTSFPTACMHFCSMGWLSWKMCANKKRERVYKQWQKKCERRCPNWELTCLCIWSFTANKPSENYAAQLEKEKKKKKMLWASVVLQQRECDIVTYTVPHWGFSLPWNHVLCRLQSQLTWDVMKCSIYSSLKGVMSLFNETENRAHVCVCVYHLMYDLTLKSCSRLDK